MSERNCMLHHACWSMHGAMLACAQFSLSDYDWNAGVLPCVGLQAGQSQYL
jgi:hypothetical protein